MEKKPTIPARPDVPTWPKGMRDILLWRVQIEDEYRHRNAPDLPLPRKTETHHTLEVTPAVAFAMGWDITKSFLRQALP